jgi:hypothetical protein
MFEKPPIPRLFLLAHLIEGTKSGANRILGSPFPLNPLSRLVAGLRMAPV